MTKLTKLEEEIWISICQEGENRLEDPEVFYTERDRAKVSAEVAKRYIEKAIKDAYEQNRRCDIDPNECMKSEEFVGIWFKANGVIE